jgi:hypothetical protein
VRKLGATGSYLTDLYCTNADNTAPMVQAVLVRRKCSPEEADVVDTDEEVGSGDEGSGDEGSSDEGSSDEGGAVAASVPHSSRIAVPTSPRFLVTLLQQLQSDKDVLLVMPLLLHTAALCQEQCGGISRQTTPFSGARGKNGQLPVAYAGGTALYSTVVLQEVRKAGVSHLVKSWSTVTVHGTRRGETVCVPVLSRAVSEAGRLIAKGEQGAVEVRAHPRRDQRGKTAELLAAGQSRGSGFDNYSLLGASSSGTGSDADCSKQVSALLDVTAIAVQELGLSAAASIVSTAPTRQLQDKAIQRMQLLFVEEQLCKMKGEDAAGRQKLSQLLRGVSESAAEPRVRFVLTDSTRAVVRQPLQHYTNFKDVIAAGRGEEYILCEPNLEVMRLCKGSNTELYIDMQRLTVAYLTQQQSGELVFVKNSSGGMQAVPVRLGLHAQVNCKLPWLTVRATLPDFGQVQVCTVIVLGAWVGGKGRLHTCSGKGGRALYKMTARMNLRISG